MSNSLAALMGKAKQNAQAKQALEATAADVSGDRQAGERSTGGVQQAPQKLGFLSRTNVVDSAQSQAQSNGAGLAKQFADGGKVSQAPVETQREPIQSEQRQAVAQTDAQKVHQAAVVNKFDHITQVDSLTQEQVESFKANLEVLAETVDDREMVGMALKSLVSSLRENPIFAEILHPEDFGLMVRALRNSYGVAITKKTEKKETKSKKAAEVALAVEELAGLDFGSF